MIDGLYGGNSSTLLLSEIDVPTAVTLAINSKTTALSGTFLGHNCAVTVAPTANSSVVASGANWTTTVTTDFDLSVGIQGGILSCVHAGEGTVAFAQGIAVSANNTGEGTITSGVGVGISHSNSGGGTYTKFIGVKFNSPSATTKHAFDFHANYLTNGVVNVGLSGTTDKFMKLEPTAGGVTLRRTIVNASTYTAKLTDHLIAVTYTTTGVVTITLPAVASSSGLTYIIKYEDGNANNNNITVDGNESELVDGGASATISAAYGKLTIYCNGAAWFTI